MIVEYSYFEAVFFDFLQDFVSDEQTFIGVKQHPQAGPGTTHIMCVKYENFFKNRFFWFFFGPILMGAPPIIMDHCFFFRFKKMIWIAEKIA